MQPLDLNLASNPFRNNTLLWVGYTAAILLLGLFTFWNVQTYREHRGLLSALRNEVGTFESQRLDFETRARRAQDAIAQFDVEALRVQADKANEVINWKAFSWTRLFNQMERIQPHQVRMNSIRPIFRAPSRGGLAREREEAAAGMPVAIEGTARGFADFAEFEHLLQEDAHFSRVEPERLNRTQSGEVVFQLRFFYRPLGEEEQPSTVETTAQSAAAERTGTETATARPARAGEPAAIEEPVRVEEPWPHAVDAGTDAPRPAAGASRRGRSSP